MALLGDTELADIKSRLLDIEKILRAQPWGPDDTDGYNEAIASLIIVRNQVTDLGMYHVDDGGEPGSPVKDSKAAKAAGPKDEPHAKK
jgi:hypothetical protein